MIEFRLDDMSCGHCEKVVRQTVAAIDPKAQVDIDLANHRVRISGQAASSVLAQALSEAGYPPAA